MRDWIAGKGDTAPACILSEYKCTYKAGLALSKLLPDEGVLL